MVARTFTTPAVDVGEQDRLSVSRLQARQKWNQGPSDVIPLPSEPRQSLAVESLHLIRATDARFRDMGIRPFRKELADRGAGRLVGQGN